MGVASMIDWDSDDSYWMVNPKLSAQEQKAIRVARKKAPKMPEHIWIRSSGTTTANVSRWVALSKTAFLVSANAVNDHLNSSHVDIWAKAIPEFHVGGLSIGARAHVSGASVVSWDPDWEPLGFHQFLVDEAVTLLSLVPTQLYDLVESGLSSPPDLRAVIIGGAALNETLYFRARELGWPVLPSYGMTEVASQVATATVDSLQESVFPSLKVLNHMQLRVEDSGQLSILSQSLFSAALLLDLKNGNGQLAIRDAADYFPTQDLVEFENGFLRVLGRKSQMVKVLGEQVSLRKLSTILHKHFVTHSLSPYTYAILPLPDQRLGADLCVATDSKHFQIVEKAVKDFNNSVEKYERLNRIYFLDELPRTSLGKVRLQQVIETVSARSSSAQ